MICRMILDVFFPILLAFAELQAFAVNTRESPFLVPVEG